MFQLLASLIGDIRNLYNIGMRKKEWEQFKTKPEADLLKTLNEYRDKLWSLKVDLVRGKVKNVKEIKDLKRGIARVLTLIKQR
jgi:ribosomal protein L29